MEATPTEIKSATERYHTLSSAYQLLSDEGRRRQYDVELEANQATASWIVNDTITLSDMFHVGVAGSGGVYQYGCRCGGVYMVTDEEAMEETCDQLIVECDTCSLHIKVIRTN